MYSLYDYMFIPVVGLSPKATKRLVVCWWASTTFSEGETMNGLGSLVVGDTVDGSEIPFPTTWDVKSL